MLLTYDSSCTLHRVLRIQYHWFSTTCLLLRQLIWPKQDNNARIIECGLWVKNKSTWNVRRTINVNVLLKSCTLLTLRVIHYNKCRVLVIQSHNQKQNFRLRGVYMQPEARGLLSSIRYASWPRTIFCLIQSKYPIKVKHASCLL